MTSSYARASVVLAEVHRDRTVFVIEDGDEFEPTTEGLDVLAKRGDPHIIGVLELRDRALGYVESSGQV